MIFINFVCRAVLGPSRECHFLFLLFSLFLFLVFATAFCKINEGFSSDFFLLLSV